VLRAEAAKLGDALAWLEAARALAAETPGVEIFQPVSAPMLKKAGLERAQLWLQSATRTDLQQLLRDWMPRLHAQPARNIRWHLDVDPAEN
jgi:primosomal protein N' (replication factor Y)